MDAMIKRDKGGKPGSLVLIILLILFVFSTGAEATCTYTISPTNQSFSSNGGTDSISVATQSGCSWTVTENLDWVTITSGSSGTGNGTVTYSVSVNNTGQSSEGTITIGNQTFTIRQAKSVFNDVTDPTHWAYPYIYAIYTEGITTGCGNNNYCPYDSVTRGQMAAFIIRALYGENFTYTTTPYFSDVPSDSWAFKYVQKLKDDGITTLSGTYMASSVVSREQMAAFIGRAFLGMDNDSTASDVAAVLQSTGPFGAFMVDKNGEMLLPLVDRDASGNATKITGALYTNNVSGTSAVVYLGDDGMPTKTVMGDYILLFSNWSADGKTVDIAKIYTPTNYIEVFKGVSVNASSAAFQSVSVATKVASNRNSISTKATCFPVCDTNTKNLAELLKIAGLGISLGTCGIATTVSLGAMALPCIGVIVSTASLVVGNETWLGNLESTERILGTVDVFQCALLPVLLDPVPCYSVALDLSSRTLNLLDKTLDENSGLVTTANIFLSDPSQPSGVVQQGGGLPSCPDDTYECTPGGAMSYLPCYPDGVRQCGASCTWGPCVGVCGDGICDTSIAGENSTNCPSDCHTVCGDSVCAAGEEISCPQDCQLNSCCVSTNDCPSETPYECGSGCCCCGWGSVCTANHVCS